MSTDFEKIEALLPDFQYVDNDGRIVLTVGFAASFYFWGGHTSGKRQALIECFEAFELAYGQHLTWAFDAEKGRTVKLADKKLPPLRDYVATLDEDDCIEWYLSSGDDDEAVGEYVIGCLTERGWMEGQLSELQFHVPRAEAFGDTEKKKLDSLLLFFHERLAPFHGNAGLTAITTHQEIEWEPEELDVATRYLALYIGSGDGLPASNGIKSVNWITFIGDMLTERMGGSQAFLDYCRQFGIEPTRHGKGFIIQAGEFPQLGPVHEPAPEAYVKANAALRPLRNGDYGSMGGGSVNGERHFDRCTSDLWIRRLDAPGIWPPASFIGLGKDPLGKPPTKKLTIKTGERSPVYGRFQRADAEKSELVLMPGDVAPFLLKLGPHGEYLGRDVVIWELTAEL